MRFHRPATPTPPPPPLTESLLQDIQARALKLPFASPLEVSGVVSIAYRNDYATQSAIVITTHGRTVICEHGSWLPVATFTQAFASVRRPDFCALCRLR